MRPTSDTINPRPDLGGLVYEVMQAAPTMGFIGLQVMPPFFVPVTAADYPVMPKEALFNLYDTKRGAYGHYNRIDGEFEAGYFRTMENGLEARVDARWEAVYRSQFDYELAISKNLFNAVLRNWEFRVAQRVFTAAFKLPIPAGVLWGLPAALPKADVDLGKQALRADGIIPNALIISYSVFLALQQVTEIRNQVWTMFPDAAKTGTVSIAHLQTYFELPKILVAGAMMNTANSGQNAILSDIWDDHLALLAKVADGPESDIIEPCVGRTFVWNEGATDTVIVEDYDHPETRSKMLRVRHDTDESLLCSFDENKLPKSQISRAAGYLIAV